MPTKTNVDLKNTTMPQTNKNTTKEIAQVGTWIVSPTPRSGVTAQSGININHKINIHHKINSKLTKNISSLSKNVSKSNLAKAASLTSHTKDNKEEELDKFDTGAPESPRVTNRVHNFIKKKSCDSKRISSSTTVGTVFDTNSNTTNSNTLSNKSAIVDPKSLESTRTVLGFGLESGVTVPSSNNGIIISSTQSNKAEQSRNKHRKSITISTHVESNITGKLRNKKSYVAPTSATSTYGGPIKSGIIRSGKKEFGPREAPRDSFQPRLTGPQNTMISEKDSNKEQVPNLSPQDYYHENNNQKCSTMVLLDRQPSGDALGRISAQSNNNFYSSYQPERNSDILSTRANSFTGNSCFSPVGSESSSFNGADNLSSSFKKLDRKSSNFKDLSRSSICENQEYIEYDIYAEKDSERDFESDDSEESPELSPELLVESKAQTGGNAQKGDIENSSKLNGEEESDDDEEEEYSADDASQEDDSSSEECSSSESDDTTSSGSEDNLMNRQKKLLTQVPEEESTTDMSPEIDNQNTKKEVDSKNGTINNKIGAYSSHFVKSIHASSIASRKGTGKNGLVPMEICRENQQSIQQEHTIEEEEENLEDLIQQQVSNNHANNVQSELSFAERVKVKTCKKLLDPTREYPDMSEDTKFGYVKDVQRTDSRTETLIDSLIAILTSVVKMRDIEREERIRNIPATNSNPQGQPQELVTVFHASRIPSLTIPDYMKRLSRYFNCSNECYVIALVYLERICCGKTLNGSSDVKTPLENLTFTGSMVGSNSKKIVQGKSNAGVVHNPSYINKDTGKDDYSDCFSSLGQLGVVGDSLVYPEPNSYTIHRLILTSLIIASKYHDDLYCSNTYYGKVGGVHPDELNALELAFLKLLKWQTYIKPEEYEAYRRVVEMV